MYSEKSTSFGGEGDFLWIYCKKIVSLFDLTKI